MYPLNSAKPWPVNQWYVAAFASEVTERMLPRSFLNQRVVLFRDGDGTAHALSGICPHRMMPMELGTLEQDRLICGYHGLEFDFTGKCVGSPTSRTTPSCSLRQFPLREAGPLLWIWVGEPALAETTPLPAQESVGIGADGWLTQCVDYGLLKARYMLLIDNLFDLSHLAFVHYSLLGKATAMAIDDARIENRNGRLVVTREQCDAPSDDHHRFNHPDAGERMTVQLNTDMVGISLISAGTARWDGPDTNAPWLGAKNFIHLVTPETETTSHYWIGITRDHRLDDDAYSEWWAKMNVAVVQQDRDALEDIERLLQSGLPMPKEVSMKSDAGALRARMRVLQMIRDEDQGPEERAVNGVTEAA